MLTSCTAPSVMPINVGMLPCRSSRVCILTAVLCFLNLAHGNRERHKSMVVESNAYQRIQTLVELHADGIVSVKRSRDADQNLREIREDSPVTIFVGVGQCGAGDF